MDLDWPLVGRRAELALIDKGLTGAAAGGLVLAGDTGVGKTRLLHEALRVAQSRAYATAWAVGTRSHASIPFGALSHLLPEQIAPERPHLPLSRQNLLRRALDGLVDGAQGRPLVVAVDDAHLLDESSAAVVHHATRDERVFVLASLRSGEPGPDAVTGLWKDGLADRIEVRPLSQKQTGTLLESALGSQVDGATLRRLWDATQGNPLLLRELAVAAFNDGMLLDDGGVWRWTGEIPTSPRLMDVIETRLGGVRGLALAALEVIAVAGSLAETSVESLTSVHAVEELHAQRLLTVTANGRRHELGLCHPVYREIVLARTPRRRLSRVRLALASAVRGHGARRREDLLRVSTWMVAAGVPVGAGLLLAASRRTMALHDFPLAERFARAALECGAGLDATELLAQAVMSQGRFREAQALLDDLAEGAAGDARRAHTAMAQASNLFWRLGRAVEARHVLTRAEAAVGEPVLRDEIAAARGGLLVFGGQTRQGVGLLQGLLRREDVVPRVRMQAAQSLVWGLSCAGRPEDARAVAGRVLSDADDLDDDLWLPRLWVRGTQPAADLFSGDLVRAESTLLSLYQQVLDTRTDWGWFRGVLNFALGHVERAQGRPATAARRLREGAVLLRDVDLANNLPACLGEFAHSLALLGDVAGAQAALAEADQRLLPSVRMAEAFIGGGRAWTAAATGETSVAVELSLRTAEATAAMGQHGLEAFALHDAARLGAPDHVRSRLSELAGSLQGELVPTFAWHVAALADGDAQALTTVSERFRTMGAPLYAAEAAQEAANAYHEEGLIASASACSALAAQLSRSCEGARTPALLNVRHHAKLTPRQREVATLAAAGFSNQDIANRLTLSLRTVENHLHAAYAKLGVNGRHELAPILTPTTPLTRGPR